MAERGQSGRVSPPFRPLSAFRALDRLGEAVCFTRCADAMIHTHPMARPS